ncbi:hypothetical protein [Paraburkholderia sp. ZP32-5]|uniref:hypothetical protein n=1 Tax=Paraburkholderia sp. ZP32-5 TaxID=2883245 RepID=UPI001F413E27|nr:hypothetical protein [Paraburkholderia sp. ZP32-5]
MGYKGPLGIVTPAEFRKRTSLTMSSRSGSTLAMDAAYDNYYANRTPDAARLLYAWLTQYRADHGNAWSKCDRNTVSGGLLEYLHNSLAPGALSPSAALTMDQKAAKQIRDVEIPHARFGVLYLLSGIKIEIDAMTTFITGAGAVGGVIGAGMTTDYSNLGSADAVRNVVTISGKGITAPAIASGGALVPKIVQKIAAESPTARIARLQAAATAAQAQARAAAPPLPPRPRAPAPPPPPPPPLPRPAPYTLPVTLEALEIAAVKLPAHGNALSYIGTVATAFAAGTPIPVIMQAAQKLWQTLKPAFEALGDLLMRAWRLRYDVTTMGILAQVLKKATTVAVDMIMKNAVPFLGGAIDVGTGLARTVGEACSRVASWSDRRHIRIRAGHPQEIAKAIEHQMVTGFCQGLVDILKGVGKMAVSVFLPGLGSLVTVAMSVIDWLIRFLSRLSEKIAIDQFLERARHFYKAEQQRSRLIDGVYQPNTEKGSLITDTKAFTDFFIEGCKASPLIPMVTLNSGLGGSLMTMIDLFDANGAQSTAMSGKRNEFDIGNDYFTRLKRYSATYMKKSGFKITHLESGKLMTPGDKVMAGYLVHAQGLNKERQSHVEAATFGSQLVNMARA